MKGYRERLLRALAQSDKAANGLEHLSFCAKLQIVLAHPQRNAATISCTTPPSVNSKRPCARQCTRNRRLCTGVAPQIGGTDAADQRKRSGPWANGQCQKPRRLQVRPCRLGAFPIPFPLSIVPAQVRHHRTPTEGVAGDKLRMGT